MPGAKYNSIKRPDVYEALRRKGYSKEKSARIANSRDSRTVINELCDAFETTREVPREVKRMPLEIRKVWTAAFTKALSEKPEELAGELAMATVKKLFKQEGESWTARKKGEDPFGEEGEGGGSDPRLDPESEEYDPTLDPDAEEYDPEAAEAAEEEWAAKQEEEGVGSEEGEEGLEATGLEGEEGEEEFEGEEDPAAEEEVESEEPPDPAAEAEGEATQAEEIAAVARARAKIRAKVKSRREVGTSDSMKITELFHLDAKGFSLTRDGFLVTEPRIARTGIQEYRGWEVGKPDMEIVRVYRPESEVFDRRAMASLAHRTITLDHPETIVNASNWKELAVGHSSEPVARDGDFIRVPLVLMDAHAIAAAQSGKSQLSVGYGAKLKWGAGQAPDGQLYDAMQTEIRANHIALVSAARGGEKLKIGDRAKDMAFASITKRKTHSSHQRSKPMTDRTMNLDGVTIELEDRDYQVLQRHLDAFEKKAKDQGGEVDALKAQIAELQAKLAEAMKRAGTTDGEVAALKQKLDDAAFTPAKLDEAINRRMDVVDRATSFFGDSKYQWMGKGDPQIRRDVVTARLGDAKAKAMNDDAIEGAFLSLTETETHDGFTRMTQSFSRAPSPSFNDRAAQTYDKRNDELTESLEEEQEAVRRDYLISFT